jgi:hypothetical protein
MIDLPRGAWHVASFIIIQNHSFITLFPTPNDRDCLASTGSPCFVLFIDVTMKLRVWLMAAMHCAFTT